MSGSVLALIFALLPAAQAQHAPATLEGIVVESATRQPVGGARLTIGSATVATSADGRFRIGGIPPGTHVLSARRATYLPTEQSVKLDAGRTVTDWEVQLDRSLEISGKLEDLDGSSAEGCSIEVMRYLYEDGKRRLVATGYGQTNDLGEYWVGGLEPGRYFVRATPGGVLLSWDGRYGTTYYPSAANVSGAEAVELTRGAQSAAVNIRMMRRQGVRLTGEVVAPEGGLSRYSGISVGLECEDSTSRPCIHGRSTRAGSFSITDVPPGTYRLRASSPGMASSPDGRIPGFSAYQTLEVGTADIDGLVLKLEPETPRDLSATVTVEGNARPGTVYFALRPYGANTITAELKPDGRVLFKNVLPGRYTSIRAHELRSDGTMLYLKEARLGDQDILGRAFDIPYDSNVPLKLTLGAVSMARVQGVVTDAGGAPAGQAMVAFVQKDARMPFAQRSVIADQTGAFALSVPEGEYRVFSWRTAQPSDSLDDPEFLQRYEARKVVLAPGVNPALTLSVR